MNEFKELIEVADRLNGPKGCPWDVKQTFKSLEPYILEEAHELLEALDFGKNEDIMEELGDLLYVVIFYAKVAEREGRFTLENILSKHREKLIRRHPHVFGDLSAKTEEEVGVIWAKVKSEENKGRKSALDRIPKGLDSLIRAEKVVEKLDKEGLAHCLPSEPKDESSEEGIGQALIRLVYLAVRHKIDLVGALRRALHPLERHFREWEEKSSQK